MLIAQTSILDAPLWVGVTRAGGIHAGQVNQPGHPLKTFEPRSCRNPANSGVPRTFLAEVLYRWSLHGHLLLVIFVGTSFQ